MSGGEDKIECGKNREAHISMECEGPWSSDKYFVRAGNYLMRSSCPVCHTFSDIHALCQSHYIPVFTMFTNNVHQL